MLKKYLSSKRGEIGYIDVAVGVVILALILCIALSVFSFFTTKATMDRMADELIEVAAYSGRFGEEFENKVSELEKKYYGFDLTVNADAWQDVGKQQVQLGDNMRIDLSVQSQLFGGSAIFPLEVSVSRIALSEKYWPADEVDYGDFIVDTERVFTFIVDSSSKTFHDIECGLLGGIPEQNRQYVTWTYEEMINKGYTPCPNCAPHDCTSADGVEAFNNVYHWGFCECGKIADQTRHEFEYDEATNTYNCLDCQYAVTDDRTYCDNCDADVDNWTHYMDCHSYTIVNYHANSGAFPNGKTTNRVTYLTSTGAIVDGLYMEPLKNGDSFRGNWYNSTNYDNDDIFQGVTGTGGVYDVYAVWQSILVPGPTFNTYVKGGTVDEVIFGYKKDYTNIINGTLKAGPIDVSVDQNKTILLYKVTSKDNSSKQKVYVLSDDVIRANPSCLNMFNQCTALKNIAYDNFDTSLVTSMERMMQMCLVLETINTETWDTSNVTTMKAMFQGVPKLKNFEVGGWEVSNITDFSYFLSCPKVGNYSANKYITYLDVSNWNTSKCTNMEAMFANCNALKVLDVSNWNVSNVTSFRFTFGGESQSNYESEMHLESIDVSKWDTGSCTNMNSMFANNLVLTEIDVSNWDISNCTNTSHMFRNCNSLKYIDVSNFSMENVTDIEHMFSYCLELKEIDVSNWNVAKCVNMMNTFAGCTSLQKLDVSKWNVGKVKNLQATFGMCSSLTELDVSNWNTGNVTNLSATFTSCSALTELDVSNWDTGKVTTLSGTFGYCSALTELDVSNWNISNVTTLYNTFGYCSSLTEIDVSNWNTVNVTNLGATFHKCSQLQTLDVSKWNTSKATNLQSLFNQCSNLKYVDVSNWDTSNCTNMSHVFIYCYQLKNLDVSGWNTDKVTTFQTMFYYCYNLRELDLSSFNTKKATNMTDMLKNLLYLEKLTIGPNFSFYDMNGNTNCGLNAPSATYIAGADGYWYRESDAKAFLPAEIPSNEAATYLATKSAT